MSHFALLVLVESPENTEKVVEKKLAPFVDEKVEWYVIGGRWNGALIGYEPDKDPRNYATCEYCQGTGTRPDMDSSWCKTPNLYPVIGNGCNGCGGTGHKLKWNSEWVQQGNIAAVSEVIRRQFTPFAILTPDGKWHEKGEMLMFAVVAKAKPDDQWQKEAAELLLKYVTYTAVMVDCHQ